MNGYILLLTNRETQEVVEQSYSTREERAQHLPDVHEYQYQLIDPAVSDG